MREDYVTWVKSPQGKNKNNFSVDDEFSAFDSYFAKATQNAS